MKIFNKINKLIISVVLTAIILVGNTVSYADTRQWDQLVDTDGELQDAAVSSAEAVILVDANTGRILFAKGIDQVLDPASITKIMTAVLTIENSQMTDMVTINGVIAQQIRDLDEDASKSGVKESEIISVKDLLYGLMLVSGGDDAVALAYHVGGTYDEFINMMNAKAIEIGMTNTTYINPTGLTDEGHVTSARDMALLAMYAKQYPEFNEIVSTVQYKPSDTNLTKYSEGEGLYFFNLNELITGNEEFGYEYATGIKTGYTKKAGYTLVSSAENDGQSLVAVVLNDSLTGRWNNSSMLFDYGFDFYDTINIGSLYKGAEITTTVEGANPDTTGDELTVTIGEGDAVYITERTEKTKEILADPSAYITEQIDYSAEQLTAPIEAGQQLGTVTYTYNYSGNTSEYLSYKAAEGETQKFSYTAPLIAKNSIDAIVTATPTPEESLVPETTLSPQIGGGFELNDIIKYTVIAILIILVLLMVILIVNRSKSNNRYKQPQSSRSHDNRGNSGRRRY